jgi:bacillithiol biosynthesis deacetylase BshB1
MKSSLDILTFAPHPDDAEIGCGGSLIRAVDQGLRVAVADLTDGEMGSRGTSDSRARERQRAAELLGLKARFSLGLPDSEIGADLSQRIPLIELIRETRPRIVLAPYGEDRHPDHAAASKLVQNACFFAGVLKVGSGKPHRPERTYYYSLHSPFPPTFVIDVSSTWERKMAAVRAYESQFQHNNGDIETALSSPDFMRTLEARAVWFGAMIGVTYGEAFYSPGPVVLDTFPGLNSTAPPPGEMPPYSVY